MKKLFITVVAIALAIGTQAATCKWSSGTLIKGANEDGSFTSANAASGTLNMYVWLVDQATYNSTSLEDIGAKDVSTATASKSGAGAAGITVTTTVNDWTADQDNPVYALVLTTYKSGDVEAYIANKAVGNINGSGTGGTVSNLAKNIGGTGGAAITSWSTAVPEPTSGLLMLVGLGALALRRRRA